MRRSWLTVWILLALAPIGEGAAPPPSTPHNIYLQAKQATVGILEDTQDQRTPDKPGRIAVRGTGVHLRDGYVVTARHAAEKHDPTMGAVIPKQIRIITADLHELPAELVGDSAFMDVVVYRVTEAHRAKLRTSAAFAAGDVQPGQDVFTVGYPMGWGPTMSFGHLGNTNTFLQTVDTRLIQADVAACSGNSGGGLFNEKGDVVGVMIECNGPSGYYTHVFRFAVMGKAPHEIRDAHALVIEAENNVLKRMKPGASCAEIFAAHNVFMREHSLPEEKRILCHGQGYEMVERPLIRQDETMHLRENMNMGLHAAMVVRGNFMSNTNNFLIGPNGPERLHLTEQKLFERD